MRVILNIVKLFRKIPYYFVIGAILEVFWLVYVQLQYSFSRSIMNNGYNGFTSVNYMFGIFVLFFVSAVLLVSYVRSFVLVKQSDFIKIFGFVFGFLILVFADIYFVNILGNNLNSIVFNSLICSIIYIIGLYSFLYLCSEDTFINVFKNYRKKLLIFFTIMIGYAILQFTSYYEIYLRINSDASVASFSIGFDATIFRSIVAISLMYLIYKMKFNDTIYKENMEMKTRDTVLMFAIYFVSSIISDILSSYIKSVPMLLNRILNGTTMVNIGFILSISPLVIILITILISVFILLFFIKRKPSNYKKIIALLSFLVIVNILKAFDQLIFGRFIYNKSYNFELFSQLNSFFITAVPTILILIFFIRSKRIKLYFNPQLVSTEL